MKKIALALVVYLSVSFIGTFAQAASGPVVEWAPFTVREGITDEAVVKAAQDVEDQFLKTQKGYLKRSLLKGKEGQWADIVFWETEAAAQAAAQAAYESPICHTYFALMKGADHNDVSAIAHYQLMRDWH